MGNVKDFIQFFMLLGWLFIPLQVNAQTKLEDKEKNEQPVSPSTDEDEITVKPVEKSAVIPPKVLVSKAPEYPLNAWAEPPGVSVVLKVKVTVEGTVESVEIRKSGGAEFDAAAIAAVLQWRFEPARYEDKPVAVRIEIPFEFPPRPRPQPSVKPEEAKSVIPPPNADTKDNLSVAQSKSKHNKTPPTERQNAISPTEDDIHVTGRRVTSQLPVVTAFVVNKKILAAAPQPTAGDMLRTVPGFYVGHPQAEGVANALFLRGFNAEHGQDFELFAGDVPVNLVGHLHAQGYADLHFLIPEVIDRLHVIEGVFDPLQGDFAVAGSGFFSYGVARRGTAVALTLGSFKTRRLLFLHAPVGAPRETFLSLQMKSTDGYGHGNRSSRNLSVIARKQFEISPQSTVWLHALGYAGRSQLPGVLRLEDVQSSAYGFFDSYSYPTAQAQSAYTTRMEASAKWRYRLGSQQERIESVIYALRTDFVMRQNLTGFLLWYPDTPQIRGAGDLHHQENQDDTFGARFQYFSGRMLFLDRFATEFTTGVQIRSGFIDQREDLIFPAQNMIWRHLVNTRVEVLHAGAFWGSTTRFFPWLKIALGARADALAFSVDDALGNRQYDVPTQQTHELGYKRTAFGTHLGPRLMVDVGPFAKLLAPLDTLRMYTGVGQGFRSPPPRSLQEGENAPFTTVNSAEVGLRLTLFGPQTAEFRLAGFYTYLDKDYVFDPTTARTTPIGDTTRTGGVFSLIAHPFKGLTIAGSWTYAHAVLQGPPLATPENPTPSEKKGDLVPYVPPHVGRLDAAWQAKVVSLNTSPLHWKVGLGASYLSRRPLPYSQWSDPVFLLDVSSEISWREWTFKLEITNALNARWHDMEFQFVSQWDPNRTTPMPARHFVAGAPRMILGTLEYRY